MILTGRSTKPRPPDPPYYVAYWSQAASDETANQAQLYEEWDRDEAVLLERLAGWIRHGIIRPWGGVLEVKRVGHEEKQDAG